MKKAAIEKASARLETAKRALERIETSEFFEQFEPAWVEFLSALKGIHSIFEASATPKKDPKAYGWYSRKIHERRKDPLLRYVHAARNAHEYGLEAIAELEPGFVRIGIGGEDVHINRLEIGFGGEIKHMDIEPVGGKLPTVVTKSARVRLTTVIDERFGDSFDPPTEHLGKPLADDSVFEVARLALSYHENLVAEADKYID